MTKQSICAMHHIRVQFPYWIIERKIKKLILKHPKHIVTHNTLNYSIKWKKILVHRHNVDLGYSVIVIIDYIKIEFNFFFLQTTIIIITFGTVSYCIIVTSRFKQNILQYLYLILWVNNINSRLQITYISWMFSKNLKKKMFFKKRLSRLVLNQQTFKNNKFPLRLTNLVLSNYKNLVSIKYYSPKTINVP